MFGFIRLYSRQLGAAALWGMLSSTFFAASPDTEADGGVAFGVVPPELSVEGSQGDPVFQSLEAVTLEAWVKVSDLERSQQRAVVNKGDAWGIFVEGVEGGAVAKAYLPDPVSPRSPMMRIESRETLAADTWYHLAAVFDPPVIRLYVDGALSSELEIDGAANTLAESEIPVGVGTFVGVSPLLPDIKPFSGSLDSVRVWTSARTPVQIRDNLGSRMRGGESALWAAWEFDQFSENDAPMDVSADRLLTGSFDRDSQLSDGVVLVDPPESALRFFDGGYGIANITRFTTGGQPADLFDEFTAEAWLRVEDLPAEEEGAMVLFRAATWSASLTPQGKIRLSQGLPGLEIDEDGNRRFRAASLVSARVIEPGVWVHFAATLHVEPGDSDPEFEMQLFFNGALDNTGSFSGHPLASGDNVRQDYLSFGDLSTSGLRIDIDEVRFWSNRRSVEQIRLHFDRDLQPSSPSLIGAWNLNSLELLDRAPLNVGSQDSSTLTTPNLLEGAQPVELIGESPDRIEGLYPSSPLPAQFAVTFSGAPGEFVSNSSYHLELSTHRIRSQGQQMVAAALIDEALQVRIFDSSGEMVVDKQETDLTPGEKVDNLKALLGLIPFPNVTDESDQYELRLLEADSVDALPGEGRSVVIVARIADGLHVRVLDSIGNVIDRPEAELETGERLEDLRQLLDQSPFPVASELLEFRRREVIRNAAWVASFRRYLSEPEKRQIIVDVGEIADFAVEPPLSIPRNLTMEAWILPEPKTVNHENEQFRTILHKGGQGGEGYGFALDPENYLRLFVDSDIGNALASTRPVEADGQWHHVGVVVDLDLELVTFYIDGDSAGSHRDAARFRNDSGDLRIGAKGFSHVFTGAIDEVRIWTEARTPQEIALLANRSVPSGQAGLEAYWKFDEGSGIVAPDDSGSNHVATLSRFGDIQWVDGAVWEAPQLPQGLNLSTDASTVGLWVGDAVITHVSEVQREVPGSPNVPTATADNAALRLLLHVDASGAVRLLKDVTLMRQPENGNLVLVTDPNRLSEFEGVKQRGEDWVGLRLGTVAYDFNGTSFPMIGGLGDGLTCVAALEIKPSDSTNPFRHKYHQLHRQGMEIQRLIQIDVTQASGDEIEATYHEVVNGLHKVPIAAQGVVKLHRVSTVEVLDPVLVVGE